MICTPQQNTCSYRQCTNTLSNAEKVRNLVETSLGAGLKEERVAPRGTVLHYLNQAWCSQTSRGKSAYREVERGIETKEALEDVEGRTVAQVGDLEVGMLELARKVLCCKNVAVEEFGGHRTRVDVLLKHVSVSSECL